MSPKKRLASEGMEVNQPSLPSTPTRLIPLTSWSDHHEWPPLGGLRHIRFNDRRLGAAHCFLKVGRRVLVDESAFLAWCKSQGGRSNG